MTVLLSAFYPLFLLPILIHHSSHRGLQRYQPSDFSLEFDRVHSADGKIRKAWGANVVLRR